MCPARQTDTSEGVRPPIPSPNCLNARPSRKRRNDAPKPQKAQRCPQAETTTERNSESRRLPLIVDSRSMRVSQTMLSCRESGKCAERIVRATSRMASGLAFSCSKISCLKPPRIDHLRNSERRGLLLPCLTRLLNDFCPPRRSAHPELPFYHLQNDGVWEIEERIPLARLRPSRGTSHAPRVGATRSG